MRRNSQNAQASRFETAVAAVGASVLACLCCLSPRQAHADAMCGPDDAKYVETIAARLQADASKVTKDGAFVVKNEYPGDGTATIVVSFVEHGKASFAKRITGIAATTPTELRPGKTKTDEPGLLVVLAQGNIGECQYSLLVRGGKFVVMPRGYKQYKR